MPRGQYDRNPQDQESAQQNQSGNQPQVSPVAEANRVVEQQRKVAAQEVQKASEASRKASEETLKEQSEMKPVPSQDDADKMMAGVYDGQNSPEEKQPEGPRARAINSVESGGSYVNRADKSA